MDTAATSLALAEREAEVCAREIAAGRSEAYARAYAAALIAAFAEQFAIGFLEGCEAGRVAERERIKDLVAGHAAQSAEAQRWLLARELDLSPDVLAARKRGELTH